MSNSKSKLKFIAIVLSFAIGISMIFVITKLLDKDNKAKEFSAYFYKRPNVVSSVPRSKILNRDGEVLVMDALVNHLIFNKAAYFDASKEQRKLVVDKLEEMSLPNILIRDGFENRLNSVDGDKIGLYQFDDPKRKLDIKNIIDKYDLSDYLFLEEERKRVYGDELNKSVRKLKKYIGVVDDSPKYKDVEDVGIESDKALEFTGTRNGISGIEKAFDNYIKSSLTNDIYLTIDTKMLEIVEKICAGAREGVYVVVMDMKNGELLTIYDNVDGSDTDTVKFKDPVYALPDISREFTGRVIDVITMIDTDITLTEDYNCRLAHDGEDAHGFVDVYHSIICQKAVENMKKNYKIESKDKNFTDYQKTLLKHNIYSRYKEVASLFYLAFASLSPHSTIPTIDYLSRNYVYKIGNNDYLSYLPKKNISISQSATGLSERSKAFLSRVFTEPVNKNICAFAPNDDYLVFIYDDNGVDFKLKNALEDGLKNYKVIL